jgi:hypothetical protein
LLFATRAMAINTYAMMNEEIDIKSMISPQQKEEEEEYYHYPAALRSADVHQIRSQISRVRFY